MNLPFPLASTTIRPLLIKPTAPSARPASFGFVSSFHVARSVRVARRGDRQLPMSRLSTIMSRMILAALLVLVAGGCQLRPWKVRGLAQVHATKPRPPMVDRTDRDLGLQIATASQAAHDQALAEVMHEVQELGDSNPAAQQKLLEELAQSQPELWSLAVQQFRSSLAYHEQLVAAEKNTATIAAADRPAAERRDPQPWPSNPSPGIQASYQPPPDEASGPPVVAQALLTAPANPILGLMVASPVSATASAAELPVEAGEPTRESTLLELSQLTFCENVYGYGAYEPYDEARFSPAEQVLLYVEVENYHSESTKDGTVTKLAATYQLLDERGERVDGGEFPDVEDSCRSRRRDFHIQYGLVLPDKIAPGKYQLRLAMRDLQSDQVGQAIIGFEIGGSEP